MAEMAPRPFGPLQQGGAPPPNGNPIAVGPNPLPFAPAATAGGGEMAAPIGRGGNIAGRLVGQVNQAPAMAGVGEMPTRFNR